MVGVTTTATASPAASAQDSNNGLAQHLSITERAAEKHVSAIFTKLDLPQSQAHHRRGLAVVMSQFLTLGCLLEVTTSPPSAQMVRYASPKKAATASATPVDWT